MVTVIPCSLGTARHLVSLWDRVWPPIVQANESSLHANIANLAYIWCLWCSICLWHFTFLSLLTINHFSYTSYFCYPFLSLISFFLCVPLSVFSSSLLQWCCLLQWYHHIPFSLQSFHGWWTDWFFLLNLSFILFPTQYQHIVLCSPYGPSWLIDLIPNSALAWRVGMLVIVLVNSFTHTSIWRCAITLSFLTRRW